MTQITEPAPAHAPVTDEDPNVSAVRSALAAAAAHDAAAWAARMHPDLVWHFRGGFPALRGDYVGVDDVMAGFVVPVLVLTDGTFRPVPVELRAVGGTHVQAHVLAQGAVAGRAVALHAAMTFRFEGALIREVWDLVEDAEA